MGHEAFARTRGTAARGARSGKLGKVLVLPGIMGTELDSVDRKGDSDRIWINFVRLIAGRIGDLELKADGSRRAGGRPRADRGRPSQDLSAAAVGARHALARAAFPASTGARTSTRAQPDSTGRSRRSAPANPCTSSHTRWAASSRAASSSCSRTRGSAMDDASGLRAWGAAGHGGDAEPRFVLHPAHADRRREAREAPRQGGRRPLACRSSSPIIGTLPGLYQMLPSPLVELGDDHKQLFEASSWGSVPVRKAHLARADAFLRALDKVTDPQRLLYVAGANLRDAGRHPGRCERTVLVLRIVRRGRSRTARARTARRRDDVLGGQGRARRPRQALQVSRRDHRASPDRRDFGVADDEAGRPSGTRREREAWFCRRRRAALPRSRRDPRAAEARAPSAGAPPELTPEEQIRLENLAFSEYLGTGDEVAPVARAPADDGPPRDGTGPRAGAASVEGAEAAPRPTLAVEVVWGDVTTIDADVYTVGHYEGVQPQRAELALDEAVSGVRGKEDYDPRSLVITQHTRRGTLRAEVGDVPSSRGAATVTRVVSSSLPAWDGRARSMQRACAGSCTASRSPSPRFRASRRRAAS